MSVPSLDLLSAFIVIVQVISFLFVSTVRDFVKMSSFKVCVSVFACDTVPLVTLFVIVVIVESL